jgi:hypothetical protein
MGFTRSQRELLAVSREEIKGCKVDVVEVHQDWSGISTVLRHIRKQPYLNIQGLPRNLMLEADRPWNAVMSLVKLAGPKSYGCGYLDTIWRCLESLAGADKRPLCLWLEDARHMRPYERETLQCEIEWAAERLGLDVRCVFLVGKTRVWNFKACCRQKTFVHSERLNRRGRLFAYTTDGLDELLKVNEPAEEMPAAKIA